MVERDQTQIMRNVWEDLVDLSPRFMGTPKEKQTVDYIQQKLLSLGLKPMLSSFQYEGWKLKNEFSLSIRVPIIKDLQPLIGLGSGSTKGGIEGKVIFLGETIIWNMYNWPRFGIVNEKDQIIGYITGRPDGKTLSQTLSEGNSTLPHFMVGKEEIDLLFSLLNQNESVGVLGNLESINTGLQNGQNIIVEFPTSNSKGKIVLCAHYDTMYNTPGAYDNTSGVAILLELANQLNNYTLNKSVEIIFMGAEEWNLAGSTAYVQSLSDNFKQDIDLVINIDGIGRGDIFEAWVGPEKVERDLFTFFQKHKELQIKQLHFKSPPPPGSDHTPFYNEGIPVCMFTINDQEIIHSSRDVMDERIYNNMLYCMEVINKLLIHMMVWK